MKLINQEKGSFDGISNKFDANIYGTSKGQIRHQLLMDILKPYVDGEPLNILDLGGGTGVMSLSLAQMGHNLTIIDVSSEALALAKKRLQDYPSVQYYCLDLLNPIELHEHLGLQRSFDMIICHAVLEWLETPQNIFSLFTQYANKNALISLSFFNYHAKVFNNLLFANFDYVEKGMPAKNTVRLNPHNPLKPEEILELINANHHFKILHTQGIRCIHDYLLDKTNAQTQYNKLIEMEAYYGKKEPYKWLGKYFHIMLKVR